MRKSWLVIFLSLMSLMSIRVAYAQSETTIGRMPGILPNNLESHNYTFAVREDKGADVFVRIDGVSMDPKGGVYSINLPQGVTGEVYGWYRDNGCMEVSDPYGCVRWGSDWIEATTDKQGDKVSLTIPERKVSSEFELTPVSLGLYFVVPDLSGEQGFWGRELKIETGSRETIVQNLSVGVYLPEGVYARDVYDQGPIGWDSMVAEFTTPSPAPRLDFADKTSMAYMGSFLDQAGTGYVIRYKSMIMPGKSFAFEIKTSTSRYKLYLKEIGIVVGAVVLLAVVVASILRLLLGKKSWGWYLTLTGLLMLFFVLVVTLWMVYRLVFSSGYTTPLYRGSTLETFSNAVDAPEMIAVPGGAEGVESVTE